MGVLSEGFSACGADCNCHDDPDDPCVRQSLELDSLHFPYWDNETDGQMVFHKRMQAGDSCWVLVEVVPGACSGQCAQIYVLYVPDLEVEDRGFTLTPGADGREASKTVFSMVECSPASRLFIRIAVIVQDGDYDDAMESLGPTWLEPHRRFEEEGGRSAWVAEDTGWSLRIERGPDNHLDWLYRLLLAEDDDNVSVIGIWGLWASNTGGLWTEDRVSATGPGYMRAWFRQTSEEVAADLACSKEEAAKPTRAETHMAAKTLETAGQVTAGAPPGFSVKPGGAAGVPAHATTMSTSVSGTSRALTGGGTVRTAQKVVVIEFDDDSIYVYWEFLTVETDADGRLVGWTRDRGDSASRAGSSRSNARGELTDARLKRYAAWGGSPNTPFVISAPPIVPEAQDGPFQIIELTTPAGATLDLSALRVSGGFADVAAQPALVAEESLILCTDELRLAPGASPATLMTPQPRILPGVAELRLLAPEAVPVLVGGNTLLLPVANLSGSSASTVVAWDDLRGWSGAGSATLDLGPGELGYVEIPIHVPETADGMGTTSGLVVTAGADGLPGASVEVLLILSDTLEAPELAIATTEAGIPEGIVACAEQIGEASGTDYKNSGFRRYRVPEGQRLAFFIEELAAYRGCPVLGVCVDAVEAWLDSARSEDQIELAGIFWDAFQAANR